MYLIQGNADLEDVCETLGLEVRAVVLSRVSVLV